MIQSALSPLVLTGNNIILMSGDASAGFLQDAYFYYFTHINEPGWKYVYDGNKEYLIAPEVTEVQEIFDGKANYDDIRKLSGIDTILNINQGVELFQKMAKQHTAVYTIDPSKDDTRGMNVNPTQVDFVKELQSYWSDIVDVRPELKKMRAIKSEAEIATIRKAIELTVNAFKQVKQKINTYNYEYEIEADFTHSFRWKGAQGHAYDPIVASGVHACTLHYNTNNSAVQKNELVLIDIGARVEGYAADITRTFAVGTPTERQIAVHAAVEDAHHKIIALLKPDLRIEEYSKSVDEIMKTALENLGLLKSPNDYRRYFPHAISHGLGIDVHDSLGSPEKFSVGMVLTVEPGIYIPEEGIGVRIEDNILITKDGHENLSAHLPTSL